MILTEYEIANIENLNSLVLDDRSSSDKDLAELVEFLQKHKNIVSIRYRNGGISDSGAAIFAGLELRALDFEYNNISKAGALKLINSVKLSLNLRHNPINSTALSEIKILCPKDLKLSFSLECEFEFWKKDSTSEPKDNKQLVCTVGTSELLPSSSSTSSIT
jgi:hypothetical protein